MQACFFKENTLNYYVFNLTEKYITWCSTLHKQKITNKKVLYLSTICHGYEKLAHNWYLHLCKIGLTESALIVCFDQYSFETLKKLNLPCIFFSLQSALYHKKIKDLNTALGVDHHTGKFLLWEYFTRQQNIELIYLDVDMIVLKDVYSYIKKTLINKNETYVLTDKKLSNIGTKNTNSSYGGVIIYFNRNIVDGLINTLNSSLNNLEDKLTTFSLLNQHAGMTLRELNPFLFPSSNVWSVSTLKNKLKKASFIIHYNTAHEINKLTNKELNLCISHKIVEMQNDNNWLAQ